MSESNSAWAPAGQVGRLVAVYSGKGGAGCTTIAANLACTLAEAHKLRVAIVDLDLQFGDVAQMFSTPEEHGSIADLVGVSPVELDTELVNHAMVAGPEGIRILPAPPRPELGELVEAGVAQLGIILTILRQNFDVVVVDVGRHLGDAGATVFEACDQVLLVTSPLTTSLKSLRLARGLLEKLQVGDSKVEIVLNHPNEHSNFRTTEIEVAIQRKLLATIPHDSRVAGTAIDSGEPFVLYRQRSAISSAVVRLADQVLELSQPVQAKV